MYLWRLAPRAYNAAMRSLTFFLLLLGSTAHAAVYKCTVAGKTTYTDQPCAPGAAPAVLPPVNAVQATEAEDLAKSRDARLARDKAARDKADGQFVTAHAEKTAQAKAVRAAIIDHRVIEGMTASEVSSAIGPAEETLPNGNTRHRRDDQRITVSYRNGVVSKVAISKVKNK